MWADNDRDAGRWLCPEREYYQGTPQGYTPGATARPSIGERAMAPRIVPGWSRKLAGRLVRPAGFAMGLAVGLGHGSAALARRNGTAAAAAAKYKFPATDVDRYVIRAPADMIGLLETSNFDGLDPKRFKVKALKRALRAAENGHPLARAHADTLLNRALFDYVVALRSTSSGEWNIVDREARPPVPGALALLAEAAAAPSLAAWVEAMPFMHPDYAVLRRELAFAQDRGDQRAESLLTLNMRRARLLPGGPARYVVVNTRPKIVHVRRRPDGAIDEGGGRQAGPADAVMWPR